MNGPNDRNPHQKKNKEKADEYLGSRRYGGGSVDAQNHHYYLNQSFYGGMWSPLSVKGPSPLQYPQQPEFELSQIRHWRDGDKEKNYSQDQNRRKSSPNEFFAGVAPNELSPPMTMKKANSCSLRDKAENVAKVEYEKLLSKRKGVTLWKVLEASLLVLKAESLESLGLRLHNVPTLRKILLLEGKVNSYIHCHVAVRKITTLHDLSLEIAQNEGVQGFEHLGLGPISLLPLVGQYFAPTGCPDVHKITTEDVLNYLAEYTNKCNGKVDVEAFLSFISNSRSVPSPQHLCVRMQNFGVYVSYIRREKNAEREMASQRAHLTALKESAAKQNIQDSNITNRIDAFLASARNDNAPSFSLSPDAQSLKNITSLKPDTNLKKAASLCNTFKINSCPYPSAAEEQQRVRSHKELPLDEYTLSRKDLSDFISSWRGICQKSSMLEVLTQMLSEHESKLNANLKKKRKLMKLFKIRPAIGLLNVAVLSMKAGHWTSLYDALEDAATKDVHENKGVYSIEAVDSIEVTTSESKPAALQVLSETDQISPGLEKFLETVLEILNQVYKDLNDRPRNNSTKLSGKETFDFVVSKILQCEKMLLERLISKESKSCNFVEQYLAKLSKIFSGITDNLQNNWVTPFPESRMQAFISQTVMAVDDVSKLSENYVFQLLVRQFPSEIIGEWYFHLVKKYMISCSEEKVPNHSIYYSRALLATKAEKSRTSGLRVYDNTMIKEDFEMQAVHKVGLLGSMTSADATKCLLKAPMLCNLLEWSHWDAIFSPSLGEFLDWMEKDASVKDLACLVTGEGTILRIDGSATVDSFLAAAAKGLGKQAALQLVSLVAMYGGVDRVPQSLLRSYSLKALELLAGRSHMAGKKRKTLQGNHPNKRSKCQMTGPASMLIHDQADIDKSSDIYIYVLEFVLEFLSSMPSEFLIYGASTVIPVLMEIVPNAAVALLELCSTTEYRVILHKIGLSLGIGEWMKDLKSLCFELHTLVIDSVPPSPVQQIHEMDILEISHLGNSESVLPDHFDHEMLDTQKGEMPLVSIHIESRTQKDTQALSETENKVPQTQINLEIAARDVISSIRKEEFGMDLDLSCDEQRLLVKQHQRIGRALNCLSRELYSQDSHFVLELVQNADDNEYLPDVDAMLVFILQQNRVVVVNNEAGFTPANMKALCDVGNSTKSGSGAGYIGHKGIGFKSVFRVTDSPEIHSRGFHVKFDISEGNIGFILPTMIPPFKDWDLIEEVLAQVENSTNHGKQMWNTCMALPLKSAIMNGPDVQMLSLKLNDVHPSLLLFLHRLCCITVKNEITGSIRIMQRYNLSDGFVRVSDNGHNSHWLVVREQLNAIMERPGVERTEIALAFPLQEVSSGVFDACHEHQQVFSFLPLRSYGLKFIIQGDFILPSSREEIDADSAWNQWLLSEIPNVCLKAVEVMKEASCFDLNIGKATSVFMSFVPLEGEVQGFFYPLPRMLLSSLRSSQCLPTEDKDNQWALPCTVLGGWDESTRRLLPDGLLQMLLGLHYLHTDVVISPALATELGIQMYGLKVLIDFMECLCTRNVILTELGPEWIRSWLIALHDCFVNESQKRLHFFQRKTEVEDLRRVKRLPFIPLSNGSYTSISESPIWLPCVDRTNANEITTLLECFPLLYSELRTVHPLLVNPLGDNSDTHLMQAENTSVVCLMLGELGVGQMSGHQVVKTHILPVMFSNGIMLKSKPLVMQYLAFIMLHLESNCKECQTEDWHMMGELQKNAIIATNNGYKRVNKEPVHFGVDFGCPVNAKHILKDLSIDWDEVDPTYIKVFQGWTQDVACMKWRTFLKDLGVTDFVRLEHVNKNLTDSRFEVKNTPIDIKHITDWESPELVKILENLCSSSLSLPDKCRVSSQLLSAFDLFWDEYYSKCTLSSDKVISEDCNPPSFIMCLRSFPWVQSSFDQKLYHPTELFYRCPAVELILGSNAPYATPQVQATLSTALGLQNSLSVSVVLDVMRVWNQRTIDLSLAQITRLYSFLWSEMTGDGEKVLNFFQSEASIFVPEVLSTDTHALVSGQFLFQKDVIWKDETGCLDLLFQTAFANSDGKRAPQYRALKIIYPSLQGFFLEECNVQDVLKFYDYYNVLKLLSNAFSPREILDQVLKVFSIWSNSIKAGEMSENDILKLKDLLSRRDGQVLPTLQDKWVSLHESQGIVCWCDDETLGQQFMKSGSVFYVCVSPHVSSPCMKNCHWGAEKLSCFLQAMGISPLSKVVEREPIVYGAQSSEKLLNLLNWVLPYVQRYLQKWHADTYENLQQPVFHGRLNNFQCITCEQLFYRYKLPGRVTGSGTERFECTCLFENDIFYTIEMDDLSTVFLEFSKLFFNGIPNLQLANFLHLITLSVQSGSQESEIETILSSQGIRSFPEDDKRWTLINPKDSQVVHEKSEKITEDVSIQRVSKARKSERSNEWPPRSFQQKPKIMQTRPERIAACQQSLDSILKEIETKKTSKVQREPGKEISHFNNPQNSILSSMSSIAEVFHQINYTEAKSESSNLSSSGCTTTSNLFSFSDREQLSFGAPNEQQQVLTGRLGEAVVYNHLLEKHGPENVKWMNAEAETGFPYDIVIDGNDGQKVLVEVKTTWSEDKDWFEISSNEWELACKVRERYIIIRVFLGSNSGSPRFLWLPNLSKLCQERVIKLALVLPQNY